MKTAAERYAQSLINGTGTTRENAAWGHPLQFAARCPDGKIRRTAWIAVDADTFFSWPAVMRINGKRVRGFIGKNADNNETTFTPYVNQTGRAD